MPVRRGGELPLYLLRGALFLGAADELLLLLLRLGAVGLVRWRRLRLRLILWLVLEIGAVLHRLTVRGWLRTDRHTADRSRGRRRQRQRQTGQTERAGRPTDHRRRTPWKLTLTCRKTRPFHFINDVLIFDHQFI